MNIEIEKFIPEKEQIAGYVVLTIELSQVRGGRRWIGKCLETGTATCNDSIDLVREELSSMVVLQLQVVDKVKQRDYYFQERGITFYPELLDNYSPRLPLNTDRYYRALILANSPGQEESWFTVEKK